MGKINFTGQLTPKTLAAVKLSFQTQMRTGRYVKTFIELKHRLPLAIKN